MGCCARTYPVLVMAVGRAGDAVRARLDLQKARVGTPVGNATVDMRVATQTLDNHEEDSPMLPHPNIEEIPVNAPHVYAFRIRGEVGAEDMKAMAATMNAAFDRMESVSMVLIFEEYEGREIGAGMNAETMKSQFRSLSKVEKYAVVGAPSAAEAMINTMDKIIPVDARTFERADEGKAWEFVGAAPIYPA